MRNFLIKSENKILLGTLFALGFIAWMGSCQHSTTSTNSEQTALPAIDTLIPKGYVLVPIELANAEPLSSLIGSTAVVDLYLSSNEKTKTGHKIGSHLKLVRAPLNPQLFAILVRDSESGKILAQPGPYFAVIQNHQQNNSEIRSKDSSKLEISYQR